MSLVTLRIDQQIAFVSLNRADKKNALNFAMFKALDKVIKTLKKNREIRVVILQAEGEDFCTGLDIKSVMSSPLDAIRLLFKWLPGNANLAQRVSVGWRRLPVPVIAVIQGRCWGGGTQIILGADIRVASPEATLSIMEARWGLIPDMGGTLALRELMNAETAIALASTAKLLSATEANNVNLITEVSDDPLSRALQIAEEYKAMSPDSIAAVKKLYHQAWGASERKILAKESWYQIKILLGSNQRIMVKRQKENSEQAFKNRGRW